MSFDRLIRKIVETKNPTVVGLDPKLEYIPEELKAEAYAKYGKTLEGAAEAILGFNKGIIDAICDVVPAVKPQCAFYERFGWQGMKALAETIAYAKEKGMFVIIDGKRNDIGSTMTAYAVAHLGDVEVEGEVYTPFGGDALTVNGYLGTDGISPLTDICVKKDAGIFVLVKTSNPSSGELQDRSLEGRPLYAAMGEMCEKWGESCMGELGYSAVGAVVGATYPEQLAEMRKAMPAHLPAGTRLWCPGRRRQGCHRRL